MKYAESIDEFFHYKSNIHTFSVISFLKASESNSSKLEVLISRSKTTEGLNCISLMTLKEEEKKKYIYICAGPKRFLKIKSFTFYHKIRNNLYTRYFF